MRGIFRSHLFIGILSIALGLAVSLILTPIYSDAIEKRGTVVRVKNTVYAGAVIQDSDIEAVNVGVFNLSSKVLLNKKDVVGKYARTNLYAGMYLVEDSLSPEPILKDLYLNDLPQDKYAISVTVQNYAAGLSSKLLQGDVVSVVVKRQDEDGHMLCEIPGSLTYVEVLSTTKETGADKSRLPQEETNNRQTDNERLATVTLLANKHQVAELSGYEGEAVIHLALKSRNDPEVKRSLLLAQEEYFKEWELTADETYSEQETVAAELEAENGAGEGEN